MSGIKRDHVLGFFLGTALMLVLGIALLAALGLLSRSSPGGVALGEDRSPAELANRHPRAAASAGRAIRNSVSVRSSNGAHNIADTLTLPSGPREAMGSVSFNAIPWANVWVGATMIGQTPLANVPMPAGEHEVTFRHPQHGERTQKFVVSASGSTRVSAVLAEPAAALTPTLPPLTPPMPTPGRAAAAKAPAAAVASSAGAVGSSGPADSAPALSIPPGRIRTPGVALRALNSRPGGTRLAALAPGGSPDKPIYGAQDIDITAPVAVRQQTPEWKPIGGDAKVEFNGLLQIIIDEGGDVINAEIRVSAHRDYDAELVRAARTWKFTPASKNGIPVAYLRLIDVRLPALVHGPGR